MYLYLHKEFLVKDFIALVSTSSGLGIALNKPHVVSYESVTYPVHRGILLSIIVQCFYITITC